MRRYVRDARAFLEEIDYYRRCTHGSLICRIERAGHRPLTSWGISALSFSRARAVGNLLNGVDRPLLAHETHE